MTEQRNNHSHEYDMDFTGDIGGADKAADRIVDSGPYVGTFTRVQFAKGREGSTKGMAFEFAAAQGGDARFTCWTVNKDGSANFAKDQIEALAYLMGVKPEQVKGAPGLVRAYVEGEGWKEVEGIRYPILENKPIGVVLQKELSSKDAGGETFRWNLYGQFEPTSKLTASELREKKTKPAKLEKMLRGLKDRDNRKSGGGGEPAQPSAGASSFEGV